MFYHFSRDSFITHLTRNGPLFYRTTATKKQPSLGNVSPINLLTLVPICKYRKRTWKLFTDLSGSLFSVSLVGLRSAAVFDIKMFVVLILWLESGAGDWATLLSTSRLVDWDSPEHQPASSHTHRYHQHSARGCTFPFQRAECTGTLETFDPSIPAQVSEWRVQGRGHTRWQGHNIGDWSSICISLVTGPECWSQILRRRQKAAAALIYLAPLNWLKFSFFSLL